MFNKKYDGLLGIYYVWKLYNLAKYLYLERRESVAKLRAFKRVLVYKLNYLYCLLKEVDKG